MSSLPLIDAIAAAFPGAIIRTNEDGEFSALDLSATCGPEAALYLNYHARENRIYVSGIWPRGKVADKNGCTVRYSPSDLWNPRVESPSITVAADKSPERIVRDIQRRLIPAYLAVLARLIARRDAADAYEIAKAAALREINEIAGNRSTWNNEVAVPFGCATVHSADSVEIKISVNRVLAGEIIRQLLKLEVANPSAA
jgi:hypothetical protein